MNLSRSKINALLALALFTFAFLAAEFRFDVNVGLLAGAERVVIAQGFILGASVLGFIGYAPRCSGSHSAKATHWQPPTPSPSLSSSWA